MSMDWSHDWILERVCETCPERSTEIRALVQDLGIEFVAEIDRDDFYFKANTDTAKIRFAVQPIARLWARAYAYQSIYTEISGTMNDELLTSKPSEATLSGALRLLRWAMDEDRESAQHAGAFRELTPYPDGLPPPFPAGSSNRLEHLACDLTMLALGVIMLHEVAHIALGHPPEAGSNAKEEEFDADLWAVHTVWDHIDAYCLQTYPDRPEARPLVRQKRSIGTALFLWWLTSFECQYGVPYSDSHPPSFARLLETLCRFAQDPNDDVWAMTHVVLGLHLSLAGHQWPCEEFDTFKASAEYLCWRIDQI